MIRAFVFAVLSALLLLATPAIAEQVPVVAGEVRKIDMEQEKLTIRHGPLPHLNMDMDMTMVFRVADPEMLEGLSEGDQIWFTAERIQGALTVTAIGDSADSVAAPAHGHGEGHMDDGEGGEAHGHAEGHGDGHDEHGAVGGQAATHYDFDRTVTIEATDIAFDMETIDVKDGETIRFVITNSGELEHEFNIGTSEMHMAHQEEMADMMEAMMNGEAMHHMHGNSVFLLPGETRVIVWTFEHAHGLEFACNVPGHYESGMLGDFNFVH
jgi:uncharacterized cupredoxin-like copper-binding protein/Cu/Ag efflux protein CusF